MPTMFVSGVHTTQSESTSLINRAKVEISQTLASLKAQLKILKTSIDCHNRAEELYTCTCKSSFVNLAMPKASCPSCAKTGHSPKSKKCPAHVSKCHACQKKGHWSVVCHSPTGTGKGTANCAFNKQNNGLITHSRTVWEPLFATLLSGSTWTYRLWMLTPLH